MPRARTNVAPAARAARAAVRGLLALAAGSCAAPGCTAPRRPLVVTDPDPSVKIPAFKKAVRTKDRAAARQLVADLNNDDPAVRLFAINALERMTGRRFGYRYFDTDEARRPSVSRWNDWLEGKDDVPVQVNGLSPDPNE